MKKRVYFVLFLLLTVGSFLAVQDAFACIGDWDCEWEAICNGDNAEVTEYYCESGECIAGETITKDAIEYDYEFCSGDDVWKKVHTCETNSDGEACIVEYDEELISSCSGTCKDDGEVYCINPPAVSTNSAINIYTNQVTLEANLDSLGDNSDYADAWFEWGEEGVGMNNITSPQSKTITGAFSQGVSGLQPGTTYEFRAVATNDGGTNYGDVFLFTTNGALPRIYTLSAMDINIETGEATLRADLTYTGGYDKVTTYFEWGSTTDLENQTSLVERSVGSFSEIVNINIQFGEIYYYRAVAENNSGIQRGEIRNFIVSKNEGAIILKLNNKEKKIKILRDGRIEVVN